MQQQEIHEFLIRYFTANECSIINQSKGHLTVQLTIELDKELMNRPFYWHYLEKTGGIPSPMTLTLITDPAAAPPDLKGEKIHFGSPRLHQIFESAKTLAAYIRLYHTSGRGNQQTPLLPWLCLNIKVSYQCDRKRDVFKSIGLHLINGKMVENFQEKLLNIPLTPKIPDYSFTLSPLIKPKSGLLRIETYLKSNIEKEDHSWADSAIERWEKDLRLLNHFYEDPEDKMKDSYETEKSALMDQYEPRIKISLVNGGLFYLREDAV